MRSLRPVVLTALTVLAMSAAASAQSSPPPDANPVAPPVPQLSPSPRPDPSATPPYNRLAFRLVGPAVAGGRVAAVAGVAGDPKLYYLGSAGGGVWKSVNAGATWSPVFDQTGVASIGAVAIDPKHHDTVWVGTGETNPRNTVILGDGLFRTTDAGKTWTRMGLRETKAIASVLIDPRDSNRIIVGALGNLFADSADRGVYRSTDGGKTWTKTLYVGPRSGTSEVVMDPSNPDVLYAGVWQFQRRPWTFTSGGVDDGIWKSTDNGVTWTRLRGHGLPEGMTGRIGLAIAPSEPKRIYALIESKEKGILWRSDDAGVNWRVVTTNTLVDQRFFYFSHVRVDPKNADHVYGVSEMLSESKDGGKTFKEIAESVHVDYHDLWIAPDDSNRMIAGEDGGYAITLDGGSTWSFSANVPIGQIYHVGYDDRTPYNICVGLQDNNGFCGPSNGLNPAGIINAQWIRITGGDGMWAWPDPRDPSLIWTTPQQGRYSIYDTKTQRNTFIQPYIARGGEGFDFAHARHRFNWDAPMAFDPFDPRVTYVGANVVFKTRDRGRSWSVLSPDLTADVKEHELPAGGPLANDVSSAEFTGALLDLEPSPKTRGEIWTGSDDGRVFLTRDGGSHWRNVTPPDLPPYGRFEMVAPSPLVAGTAYAVYDMHYLGDMKPYAFVTSDYGTTWTNIAAGLPAEPVRAIRPDPKQANLVYLGTETGFYLSYDRGRSWEKPTLGLPPVSVFDIRVQPRFNDLILATHGRDAYILDDLTPIQHQAALRASGAALLPIRTVYAFTQHADDEGVYTGFAAKNPPAGAIVTFYQKSPQATRPEIEILDARYRIVRHIRGTNEAAHTPAVSNYAGFNRVTWDLREDGPTRWEGAGRDAYRGPRTGVAVSPGTYFARMTLDGRSFTERIVVQQDPRVHYTDAQYAAAYAFAKKHVDEFGRLDAALNRLDGVIASSKQRAQGASSQLTAQLAAVRDAAMTLRGRITADYENDEDFLTRPDKLREDLQRLTSAPASGVSAATADVAARIDAEYAAVMHDVDGFFATDVARADAALASAGRPALAQSGAKRIDVVGTPTEEGPEGGGGEDDD